MKKTKFLALVLVVSVSLIGAGYAYWTDSLLVENTVSTGELEVVFRDEGSNHPNIFVNAAVNPDDISPVTDKNYITTNINSTNGSKTATLTITNLYPGNDIPYYLWVENTGDIPAVFKDAKVEFDNSKSLKKVLQGRVADGNLQDSGAPWIGMNELETSIETYLAGLRLEPGEVQSIQGSFYLPPTVENKHNAENQTLEIDFTFNWTQHNDPDASAVPTSVD